MEEKRRAAAAGGLRALNCGQRASRAQPKRLKVCVRCEYKFNPAYPVKRECRVEWSEHVDSSWAKGYTATSPPPPAAAAAAAAAPG